jgi:hypothetical protein
MLHLPEGHYGFDQLGTQGVTVFGMHDVHFALFERCVYMGYTKDPQAHQKEGLVCGCLAVVNVILLYNPRPSRWDTLAFFCACACKYNEMKQ